MTSTELRLYNWVSNVHGIPMIIKAIYEYTIYVDFKGNVGGLWEFNKHEPFTPIPITEDILLNNCGMHKVGKRHYHYDDFRVNLTKVDNCWLLCIDNLIIREIKYLHEWQNAFQINTGYELEIDL